MATVREVTLDLLRDLGMTTVFGNPGSTELPFLKSFPDDFSYVLGLQEATVLAMAEGFARATENAALVNLHTAPGLGNAMGAMVGAHHNKTPLVVTAGQQDRRHVALEPLLSGSLVELARPYVKRSHEPLRAEDVPREVLRAYHTAMQPPTGPVFLSIPMDDWDAEAEPLAAREVSHATAPDQAALERVAAVLREARNPALVVGAGVARNGAFDETVALAERLGAPAWQDPIPTLTSFPQRHPLFAGHLPPSQKALASKLSGHDVVLVLGAPVFLYYPYAPGPALEGEARLYQLTDDPEEASRAAVGTSVLGDVRAAVRGLLDLLPESGRPLPAAPDAPPVPEARTPISVEYAMYSLSEVLSEETIVFDEAISSKSKLHKHVRLDSPGAYHTAASGGLGYAMPASVGFKLGSPELPVICAIGDGSSMYSIQALWTAARYGANVVFFVINNRGYSILKGFRDAIGAEAVPGLDVPDVDLVAVAHGLGVEAERVEKAEALPAAVKRALGSGRPYLLDVIVDPEVPELLS